MFRAILNPVAAIMFALIIVCLGAYFGYRYFVEDRLVEALNSKWPAITLDAERTAAISNSADMLKRVSTPNIRVEVKLADVVARGASPDVLKAGVKNIKAHGDRQLIGVDLEFSKKFTEEDGGKDKSLSDVLKASTPQIDGHLRVYFSLKGEWLLKGNVPVLTLRGTPIVDQIQVDKIIIGDTRVSDAIVGAITTVLTQYKANISSLMRESMDFDFEIPVASNDAVDPKKSIQISQPGTAAEVNITGNPVSSPVKLGALAWLINDEAITVLAQLDPAESGEEPYVPIEPTFEAVETQFVALTEERFGDMPSDISAAVAIRKSVIAYVINKTAAAANICVYATGQVTAERITQKIDIPDGSSLDCSSDRSCRSNRDCNIVTSHDTRDCSTCILSRPKICAFGGCVGGGCIQRGNDPLCEIAKAAQNKLYEADAAGRRLDCERIKAQDNVTCEVEKAGEKFLCEAGKAALKAISDTGNFANLEVDSKLTTDSLQACVKRLDVSDNLSNVGIGLGVVGSADANIDLKFVPLDIVGHLACQFPWTETQKFKAELREEDVPLSASIRIEGAGNTLKLSYATQETTLKAKVSPGPTEFLLSSVNSTLACQGLNLLKPFIVSLTPFIPALKGEIDYKLSAQEAAIEIELPRVRLGMKDFGTALFENDRVVGVTSRF